ncbi:MAG TPA: hypothetical protein VHC43_12185 [Mycobacteriales bacterium]|nr:hypothetical protein [Mycobacteriales bacterium]HVW80890.1 hypothetical protein [Mycobacteriales bacterium]
MALDPRDVGRRYSVSLANPLGSGTEGSLPELLRRVATTIEEAEIALSDIIDMTVGYEVTANGLWWNATVYWSAADWTEPSAHR